MILGGGHDLGDNLSESVEYVCVQTVGHHAAVSETVNKLIPATRPANDPPLEESVPLAGVLGTPDLRLKHWGEIGSVTFSPDGKWRVPSGGGEVKVWDAASGKLRAMWERSCRCPGVS